MQPRLSESEFRSLLEAVEQRILDGERKVSESVFAEFPLIENDSESALEVIYREYAALEQLDEAPSLDDLCQRFPQRTSDLQDLFAVHEAIAPESGSAPETGEVKVGMRVGHYKLLEEIGEGGFGVVYMAEQIRPVRRRVAVKIIKPGMDTRSAVARFEAERQALAMMDHSSICRVLDAGSTESGHPYFVMELVRGMPITDYCIRERLSTRRRLQLFRLVCSAVQHAHSKSIIHRDLKPSNVMVTLVDGEPVPKIIDFGISKALEHRLTDKTLFTRYGQMIGTPMYMSPEQADMSSLDVDIRSDVYSLGVLLYELLTGTTPFNADRMKSASFLDVVKIILEEDPPTPSSRVQTLQSSRQTASSVSPLPPGQSQTLRGDLDHIVMKAVEKDRDRRYQTVYEFSQDVERYLNREPVLATSPSPYYRFRKFVNRNRLLVASGSTIIVGLLVGLSLALAGLQHARNEQAAALAAQQGERQQRLRAEAEELAAKRARDEEQVQRQRVEASLYYQKIARAKGELDAQHLQDARNLLADCSPQYRGWEWHYLDRLCQSDTLTLDGHTNEVSRARISPDGKWIVSCSSRWNDRSPGEIILWEFATGELVRLFGRSEGGYRDVCFSPNSKMIASASPLGGVSIWDVESGRVLFQDSEHRSHAVAFSPRGSVLAAGGTGGRVRLYNTDNGALIREILHSNSTIHSVAFNPQGVELAAVCNNGWLSVWDPQDDSPLFRATRCGDRSVAFSPDGKVLVTGGYYGVRYGRMRVFGLDRGTFNEIDDRYTNFGTVGRMEFSPDSRAIAFQSNDNVIRLWDPRTGRQLKQFAAHDGSATSCCFSPDTRSMVTTGGDMKLRRWSHSKINTDSFETEHHRGFIPAIDFSKDGTRLLAAGGLNIGLPSAGLKEAQIYQLSEGSRRLTHRLLGFDQWMTDVSFASDDSIVVATGDGGGVHCWDARTGESLWTAQDHNSKATCLAVSPDSRVATGSDDGVVLVHDKKGNLIHQWNQFQGAIHDVCFHPNRDILFVAYDDGKLATLDSDAGLSLEDHVGIATQCTRIAISRDGNALATGTESGLIDLYQVSKRQPNSSESIDPSVPFDLKQIGTLTGHTQEIREMDFHPDGTRLASVSKDQRAIVWSVKEQLSAVQLDPEGLNNHVLAIRFGPGGNQLAVTRGFEITIWNGTPRLDRDVQKLASPDDDPSDTNWHRQMAEQCWREGNWFGVAFHCSQVLTNNPSDVDALRRRRDANASLRNWAPALKDAQALCQNPEKSTIRDRLCLGLLHIERGDFPKYREQRDRAIQQSRSSLNDPSVANQLGWLSAIGSSANEVDEDVLSATDRAANETNRYAYWNTYGTLLLRAEKYSEAMDAIWKGLHRTDNPVTPHDWLVLAMASYQNGQMVEAFDWFDRAAWTIDRILNTTSSLRWTDRATLRQFRDEVADVLRGHLKNQTESDNQTVNVAWLAMTDKQRDLVAWHRESYRTERENNALPAANEHAKQLCELRPNSVDSWLTLADALAAIGDPTGFETAYHEAEHLYGAPGGLLLSGLGMHVETESIPFDSYEQFTIEAWVDRDWERAICAQGFGGDPENSIWLATIGNVPGFEHRSAGWENDRGRSNLYSRLPRLREPWNHVALIFDGRTRALYVNGTLHSRVESKPPGELNHDRSFLVGAAIQSRTVASIGCMRSIRVSSTAKYVEQEFEPTELTADTTTELLYDFTAADRDWIRTGRIRDLSSKGRDGALRHTPGY